MAGMKNPNKVSVSYFVVQFLFCTWAMIANASMDEMPPSRWREDFWRVSLIGDYYNTNANFGSSNSSSYNKISSGNSFYIYEFRPRIRYNPSKTFSTYFGAGGANISSQTGTNLRTNSNFTDVYAGSDISWNGKVWRMITELEGSFNLQPTDVATKEALLSDGAHYLKIDQYLFRPFKFANPYAHFGLKYRTQGLSQLYLYGFGFEKPFAQQFLVGVGIEGEGSFVSDSQTPSYRETVTNNVNGGSHYFNAYNPAYTQIKAWVGWMPETAWQVKFGYGQEFQGANTSYGQLFYLSLSFNFDPRAERDSFEYYKDTKSEVLKQSAKKIEKFKDDAKPIDPGLFQEEERFEPFE